MSSRSVKSKIGAESVARGVLIKKLFIGFHYSHDLDFRAVQRLLKESVYMSVDQAYDADAEWRLCGG